MNLKKIFDSENIPYPFSDLRNPTNVTALWVTATGDTYCDVEFVLDDIVSVQGTYGNGFDYDSIIDFHTQVKITDEMIDWLDENIIPKIQGRIEEGWEDSESGFYENSDDEYFDRTMKE